MASGLKKHSETLNRTGSRKAFELWTTGKTGDDLVDAAMRELRETGYQSNRARQNAASYWIHDMKQPWRIGAAYFECMLLDYDPASNWGNWAYIAGVGNDPRPFRKFHTQKQAEQYDPEGSYRAYWSGQ
jgi:deoxyribodipyrimidine photo-lyase